MTSTAFSRALDPPWLNTDKPQVLIQPFLGSKRPPQLKAQLSSRYQSPFGLSRSGELVTLLTQLKPRAIAMLRSISHEEMIGAWKVQGPCLP